MKMMKTDLEFVTFDAQDVITTSTTGSGFVNAYFQSQLSLIGDRTYQMYLKDSYWVINMSESDVLVLRDKDRGNAHFSEGNYYQLSQTATLKLESGFWDISGATQIDEAATKGLHPLETVDAIFEWIRDNAGGIQ